MKKLVLIFCFLILFVTSAAAKTDSVINIDKIPKDGILLDKGWKFHAGDNPAWAKPDIDDSGWGAINPATDIYYLTQVRNAEIGWFRLKLHIDTSLANQSFAFNISQAGASEIYLNGRLIYNFGVVNKDYSKEKTVQMIDQAFTVRFDKQSTQVIAIRYSFNRKNFFINLWGPNPCLQLTFNNANEAFTNYQGDHERRAVYELILIPLYLLIGLMSLSLYFSFRIKKAYLYFGVYGIFAAFSSILLLLAARLPKLSISWYSLLDIGDSVFSVGAAIPLLLAIYALCEKRKSILFYLVIIYAASSIATLFFLYRWSGIFFFSFTVVICIEILRVLIIATRNKIPGTKILFGLFSCVVLLCLIFLCALGTGNFQMAYFFAACAFILVPVGISVFLASEYARTGRSLQARVIEVEQLSEKTIFQEKEKQQILAAQNETLELQVTERTAALNQSLTHLKATQTQLIQSEKMASLGELTAGIAHEIQNPLNFVNNFSEVSIELLAELKEEEDKGNKEDVRAIADDLSQNLEKILHHGKRADAIVKGMLQHSQSGGGTKEPTNINALADECMRLAYHSLRAKDKSFNAELLTHFDETLPKINVIPQDMVRVMFNLFNNALYAVNQKQKTAGEMYKPEVSVITAAEDGQAIIRVKDNGVGIPDAIKQKIMQPFFTTKPTGEGTGLGLSLTYDMVVKGHGGSIQVNSVEGKGSEFIIQLPLK